MVGIAVLISCVKVLLTSLRKWVGLHPKKFGFWWYFKENSFTTRSKVKGLLTICSLISHITLRLKSVAPLIVISLSNSIVCSPSAASKELLDHTFLGVTNVYQISTCCWWGKDCLNIIISWPSIEHQRYYCCTTRVFRNLKTEISIKKNIINWWGIWS